MSIMMGRWDCKYCGHVGNPGPETKCGGCGVPRDPDVQFYLPEDAQYIKDQEELANAGKGADWSCQYCGSDNKALSQKCRSCGNTRSDEDSVRKQKDYDLSAVPKSAEDFRREDATKTTPPQPKPSKRPLFIALIVILAVLGFLFYPRSKAFVVSGHSWERTIEISAYKQVEDSGWELPAQAQLIRSFNDVHHKEKVIDRYETKTRKISVKVGTEEYVCGKIDMGNGYFKDKLCVRDKFEDRQETYQQPIYKERPVYQTKYVYYIKKWVPERVNKAAGSDKSPKWPTGPPAGDNFREGEKTEKYVLHIKDDKGKPLDLELAFDTWNKYAVKDKVTIKQSPAGGVSLAE